MSCISKASLVKLKLRVEPKKSPTQKIWRALTKSKVNPKKSAEENFISGSNESLIESLYLWVSKEIAAGNGADSAPPDAVPIIGDLVSRVKVL